MQELPTGILHHLDDLSQAAKDRVVPKREDQGPVFTVGEEVQLKGGRFRISAITEKRLYLDSLPIRP